jgi:imidazoleglycerol-phosphate dehydratase
VQILAIRWPKGRRTETRQGSAMTRTAIIERKTKETQIKAELNLDGSGVYRISTGIGFFDHMLTLFTVHGLMDCELSAAGDIDVDYHHTVEDVGLVLGDAVAQALGDHSGIQRYGNAVIPMDDALAQVTVDLSNRPYLVFRLPDKMPNQNEFDASLATEFLRAFAQRSGMNLHITVPYGENWHHMIEAVFKGLGRSLRSAVTKDARVTGVPSTKGAL